MRRRRLLVRRPDGTGALVLAGVVGLGVASAAVYLLARSWLGGWLSGHLTNTVFVFVVVVCATLTGLTVVVDRRVGYLLGASALVAALGLEVLQQLRPGQAFDPADAGLSVLAYVLGSAVVWWLDRAHLVPPPRAGSTRPGGHPAA